MIPFVVGARIAANHYFGLSRRVWRYVNISDAVRIHLSVTAVSVILLVMRITLATSHKILTLPFGIIAFDYLLAGAGMLGVRVLRRIIYERTRFEDHKLQSLVEPRRVLLVGAGSAGVMTMREIASRRDLGIEVCGFVDDDEAKRGSVIHNVTVWGSIDDLPDLIKCHRIDQVIITMAAPVRKTVTKIMDLCKAKQVNLQIIPGLYEILVNRVRVTKLHPVEIEDLLGRETIDVKAWLASTKSHYHQKKILVTGAAGSIGRELCRQLLILEPKQIIMLDKDENSTFETLWELRSGTKKSRTELIPAIADLRMTERLEQILTAHKPSIVFHAAAYKHVPLMEVNATEAIINNVVGTMHLLEQCGNHDVERCVMVSTDKAVNPSSIMGATKRIAELWFQAKATRGNGHCKYSCVRFGNVLGSRGSVVPLFREQIRRGGPVTVTDPRMIRYFMTIPEAAQLIIQAGAIGEKGEIFLLDMGEPVKIVDLAENMVRLSGIVPYDDMDISFVGIRPGEKLREQLLIAEEGTKATKFNKIYVAPPLDYDWSQLEVWTQLLVEAANAGDERTIRRVLTEMGIGFKPADLSDAPDEECEAMVASERRQSGLALARGLHAPGDKPADFRQKTVR
jgi:FlaA1/EpsC-like NDP-sugar epimerase